MNESLIELNEALKKLNIVVLKGGETEKDISFQSAESVLGALSRLQLKHVAYDVSSLENLPSFEKGDFVFSLLHGGFGENGELQKSLQEKGIPFVGTKEEGCAFAMNKAKVKTFWRSEGIKTAPFILLPKDIGFIDARKMMAPLGLPIAIKPNQGGSSLGITKLESWDEEAIMMALSLASLYDDWVLVESWVHGMECTASLLREEMLPLISIKPSKNYYDYESKYLLDNTKYQPLTLEGDCLQKVQEGVLATQKKLELLDCSRVDFILDSMSRPSFLEVNTTPGMTNHSLLPKAAGLFGLEFDALILDTLQEAFKRQTRLL